MSAQANPNYRVEHVAEVGKVIEIFHPVNENPCAMATKIGAKVKQNPSEGREAEKLYEQFHGKSPEEISSLQESCTMRRDYTGLGLLSELVIDAPSGEVTIGFYKGDAVTLASAPNGQQLYLIGGNQNLDSQLERFGSDPGKDFVEMGVVVKLTYRTRKRMDDFKLVDYWHLAGEETGEPPLAFYDRLKRRIFLVGGRYRVEAPGIIN